MKPFSIYIHIPYCFHKCPYCDFNTYAVSSIPEKDYISAILAELDYYACRDEWRGRVVQSVYFGGGTPSLLDGKSIWRVMSYIVRTFPVDTLAEVSLEANPGTVVSESLKAYRDSGINRISFGAQSFQQETLKKLGRIHTPDQVRSSVDSARGAGLNNISLDLMYGIQEQTLADVRADLKECIKLDPNHISAYGLTIEKGTPFFESFKKGALKLPQEDVLIEMVQEVNAFLPMCGYQHYEISNFGKVGFEAKHNLAYWNGDDYLGLGAGAHSFCGSVGSNFGYRWANLAVPNKYIETAVSFGKATAWEEELKIKESMFEFFFLGLRKIKGVALSEFTQKFGLSIEEAYPAMIQVLIAEKLIEISNGYLRLSPKGFMVADNVIENFASPESTEFLLAASI